MRYRPLILFLALICCLQIQAQQIKHEREHRIRREQFPEAALEALQPYLDEARRLRFYREIDSNHRSFEAKFRIQRLQYSIEFTPEGELEDAEVDIKPVDIPRATWQAIQEHLGTSFGKFHVRKIQQQYPRPAFDSDDATLKAAFQNLLLPEIRYELVVQAKTESGVGQFEALYDSEGNILLLRKALPPNYDHVLY